MDRETLVPWLTLAGLLVTSLISPFILQHMKDFRERRADEDSEADKLRKQRDNLWLEYMKLRETFSSFTNRTLREVQRALFKLEQSKEQEGYQQLLEHATKLEAFELPPVPDLDEADKGKTDRGRR